MSLFGPFSRRGHYATPLSLKIGVILQGLLMLLVGGMLLRAPAQLAVMSSGVMLVQVLLLIAIWNLRRWAILAYGGLVVLDLVRTAVSGDLSGAALISQLLVRGIVMVPALACWRRMDGGAHALREEDGRLASSADPE
jgi:hypothetical protein